MDKQVSLAAQTPFKQVCAASSTAALSAASLSSQEPVVALVSSLQMRCSVQRMAFANGATTEYALQWELAFDASIRSHSGRCMLV